jgi:hypothetical protein
LSQVEGSAFPRCGAVAQLGERCNGIAEVRGSIPLGSTITCDFLQIASDHPVTPDGRYFVVRGRLWRRSNPELSELRRAELVSELMRARRAVGAAMRAHDRAAEKAARADVDAAKHALGERGPVWWSDGAPDCNRHLVRNTPYAEWYAGLDTG